MYHICYWIVGVDGLRQRGGAQSESDLDSMIQYHHQVQEKIADDMVHLARTMKDHAQAASQIVKTDIQVTTVNCWDLLSLHSYWLFLKLPKESEEDSSMRSSCTSNRAVNLHCDVDFQKLQDANKLADSNYSQLKIESARLEEHKNKSSCWMLLLLLFVFIVFIWMIIFMKIFPKPRS